MSLSAAFLSGLTQSIVGTWLGHYIYPYQRIDQVQYLLHRRHIPWHCGLYRKMLLDIPYSLVFLMTYDRCRRQLANEEPSSLSSPQLYTSLLGSFLSGTFAGACAIFVTLPATTINNRWSLLTSKEQAASSLGAFTRQLLLNEGLTTFFRGAASHLVHRSPFHGLLMMLYEYQLRTLKL